MAPKGGTLMRADGSEGVPVQLTALPGRGAGLTLACMSPRNRVGRENGKGLGCVVDRLPA